MQIIEHRSQYDGEGTAADVTCRDVNPADGAQTKTCTISFNIDKKMEQPVYVYYQLDNFYQNHRRYVKSRSDKQLRGETVVSSDLEDCAPLTEITLEGATTPKSLSPCGLIANSLFNDTIALTTTGVTMAENGIAWSSGVLHFGGALCHCVVMLCSCAASDIDKKFKNGNENACTAACDQDACTAALTTGGRDSTEPLWQACTAACTWDEANTQYGFNTYPSIIPKYPYDPDPAFNCLNKEQVLVCPPPESCHSCCLPCVLLQYGVTNEHFVVWMRTAGLPNFRKLYGKIEQDLEAGTTLTFDVVASFPVTAFGGKKFVVISTTSWFGGKNPFLVSASTIVWQTQRARES